MSSNHIQKTYRIFKNTSDKGYQRPLSKDNVAISVVSLHTSVSVVALVAILQKNPIHNISSVISSAHWSG